MSLANSAALVRSATSATAVVAGVLAVAFMASLAQPAHAALVYGTYVGANVTFENVKEDSGTDSLPLYGTPTLQSSVTNGAATDRLVFAPVDASFRASASGTAFVQDETDGVLSFNIIPHAGEDLVSINVIEGGDWLVLPGSNGQVNAGGGITILALNGSAVLVASPLVASINDDGTWSASGTFDLSQLGQDVTSITVAIDNSLLAQVVENAGSAMIAKKAFVVEVTSMPEPGTMLLLAGGALAMLYRRGRRDAVAA